MKMIGFYCEMDSSNPEIFRESLHENIGKPPNYSKKMVRNYLDSGYPIFDITETTVDVIASSFRVPGGSSLLSDGLFVWRADLSMYVERYGVALPEEFVDFMGANDFSMPPASHESLLKASVAAGQALGFRVDDGAAPVRED
ncbi:hypothetical protein [Streptomyces xantholiticus]|uniref:hypothetical protein n=1 Tax=Streptomyces xantholiticus TaxID=68285 RepID=UPI00167BAED3|nr:hypothetical protein [Streptomyces xantholiticus]GGW58615.1 hypothetical protein GCM10010381_49670 [Streptomyces xantholiticus]